jgi:hypothetical protein
MQNKFLWDPLEYIYAFGLTKSLFMDYCITRNSKNEKVEEIIYKNPYMFIH